MLDYACADLRTMSRVDLNTGIILYLHAQFLAREGSTNQANFVSQWFSQAFREAFPLNARRGNRPHLVLTTPGHGIHGFHLDH